jgi:hypothetical protein
MAGDLATPPKYSVRASYTSDIADLTAATTTCDTAVTLVEGDLVLLTEQSTASQNGIYQVGAVASGVAPLTRYEKCTDADGLPPGTQIFISEGTARGNLVYQHTTDAPIVVGTTSLVFAAITQVASAPTISSFTNAAHDHEDAAGGGQITPADAFDAAVPCALGGTNLTSYTAGDVLYASGATTLAKLAKGAAGEALVMNSGATAPEWAGPRAIAPAADLPAHVGNDIIPTTIESGAMYTIPALDAGSTITLPAASPTGTYCWIIGDGTTNDQTVQVRDATGPTNLTAALSASKRLCIFCLKVGAAWYASAHVSP